MIGESTVCRTIGTAQLGHNIVASNGCLPCFVFPDRHCSLVQRQVYPRCTCGEIKFPRGLMPSHSTSKRTSHGEGIESFGLHKNVGGV
jgi:hypothetical protein